MIQLDRYVHQSWSSVDMFFQGDEWLYQIRINDYQLVTIFWNLFLVAVAWLFYWLLRRLWLKTGFDGITAKLSAALLALAWLLFIPNTIYIVSDVRHLLDYCPIDSPFQVCEKNAWMILFFFTYGAIGWVSFVYLLNSMKRLVRQLVGRLWAELWLVLLMPLIALGFLLGLVHRWNSWEAFIYPQELAANLLIYLNEPRHFTNWLIFTIFLYILYWGGTLIFKQRED